METETLTKKHNNKKFVTGATGFVGQNLVNSLTQKGYEVYILTRKESNIFSNNKNVKVIIGDITDPITLPEDVDTIYHCAGVINKSEEIERVNILGTKNIVEVALKNKCKLIYLSSAGITGKTKEKIIDENTKCDPQNDYEISKYKAEEIVKGAIANGLKTQILRPTTIFGHRNNMKNDSFFQLVKSMRTGLYKNIGQGIYNIVHINEVIKALELLDKTDINNDIYIINNYIKYKDMDILVKSIEPVIKNKTTRIPYSIAFIITILLSLVYFILNKKNPLTFSRLGSLTNHKIYSQDKIQKNLLYENSKTIEEYIKETTEKYIRLELIP